MDVHQNQHEKEVVLRWLKLHLPCDAQLRQEVLYLVNMANECGTTNSHLSTRIPPPPLPPPLHTAFDTNAHTPLELANAENLQPHHTSDIDNLFGSDFEFNAFGAVRPTDMTSLYNAQLLQQHLQQQQQQLQQVQQVRQNLPHAQQQQPTFGNDAVSKKRNNSDDNLENRDTKKRAPVLPSTPVWTVIPLNPSVSASGTPTSNNDTTASTTTTTTHHRLLQLSDNDDEISDDMSDDDDDSGFTQQPSLTATPTSSTQSFTCDSEGEWEDDDDYYYEDQYEYHYEYEHEGELQELADDTATSGAAEGTAKKRKTKRDANDEEFAEETDKSIKKTKKGSKQGTTSSSNNNNSKSPKNRTPTRKSPVSTRVRGKDDSGLKTKKKLKCKIANCVLCKSGSNLELEEVCGWRSIIIMTFQVVYYHRKLTEPNNKDDWIFLERDLYDLLNGHWALLTGGKPQPEKWRKTLQDTLSHNAPNYFISGLEQKGGSGWWKLKPSIRAKFPLKFVGKNSNVTVSTIDDTSDSSDSPNNNSSKKNNSKNNNEPNDSTPDRLLSPHHQ